MQILISDPRFTLDNNLFPRNPRTSQDPTPDGTFNNRATHAVLLVLLEYNGLPLSLTPRHSVL